LVLFGRYNDTSIRSAELCLLTQINMPLYTVSAWFILSGLC
jgi:hypothetical protein